MGSYVPPFVGPAGLQIPLEPEILSNLLTQFLAIYGQSNYVGPDTADYQDTSIRALQYSDANAAMQQVFVSLNPLYATGVALDNCGVLIGTARKQATSSTVSLTITGTPGAIINNGLVQDQVGNFWALPVSIQITGSGTVQTTATCQLLGIVTADPNTITTIATPTAGWTSVTNPVAVAVGGVYPNTAGLPVEADSQYRARLLSSQAQPSLTTLAGTAAAIAAVPNVTRSQVYENPTNSTDVNGIPPHSICCVVEGGDPEAVCQAIYDHRGIGCNTFGGATPITRSIVDPSNGNISLPISYMGVTYLQVYVSYNIHPLSGYTSAVPPAIQANVLLYLSGLSIGEDVYAGELINAALDARANPENPTFAIRSLSYGTFAVGTPSTADLNALNPVIVVPSTIGLINGQVVIGAGILPNTTILQIAGLNVTLSQAPVVTGVNVPISVVNVNPAGSDIVIGFAQAAQTNSSNIIVTLV